MNTENAETGIWYNVDPEKIGREFDDFRKSSYFPEDFRGILNGIVPSKDREIQIIRKNINVDLKKRDGNYAPCNLCHTKAKWLRSGYLILDELGHLYLIGPDCGNGHFPDFVVIDHQFDKDTAYNRAYDFLLDEITHIIHMVEYIRQLLPFAETFESALSKLKKSSTVLDTFRKIVNKQDGNMLVYARRQVIAANGNAVPEEYLETYGKLSGGNSLNAFGKNSPVSQLYDAIEIFKKFGHNENTAFTFLADTEAKNKDLIAELASEIRGANAKVAEAYKTLETAQIFFSVRNFNVIKGWVEHPDCPEDFEIEIQQNHRMIWASNARKHYRRTKRQLETNHCEP